MFFILYLRLNIFKRKTLKIFWLGLLLLLLQMMIVTHLIFLFFFNSYV